MREVIKQRGPDNLDLTIHDKALTPEEERTRAFFNRDVDVVAADLSSTHRRIAIKDTDIVLQIDEAQAYQQVGKQYKKGKEGVTVDMPPGQLWAFPIPRANRKGQPPMKQALMTVPNLKGETPAPTVVRLTQASRYVGGETNDFVPMPREGDIANALGLNPNEVASLQFGKELEDNTLYVVRHQQTVKETQLIPPDEANAYIAKFLE